MPQGRFQKMFLILKCEFILLYTKDEQRLFSTVSFKAKSHSNIPHNSMYFC